MKTVRWNTGIEDKVTSNDKCNDKCKDKIQGFFASLRMTTSFNDNFFLRLQHL